jgi:glycosyltransferase involved in cell wall biosynthesis
MKPETGKLIEILRMPKVPNIKINIGDMGTQRPQILAKKLGVHENLVFTGAVPHDTLSNYLALSDLEAHWFFRKHPHKAPGIAAQEAMGAGKVVITAADKNCTAEAY